MFDQLGEGVFRRRFDSLDLNVGVVIGEDGVLVVDTRASEREASELSKELRTLTSLPVRWVVNTHWHWDHVFGNAVFQGAEIWGHVLCLPALETLGERMRQDARRWLPPELHQEIDAVEIVAPDRTFSESASLAIGRDVLLTYHGLAHTDADIVVRVPEAEVAFFGDMVEEGAPPNFGDSYPESWPQTLRRACDGFSGTAVPGHGDVVDENFVRSQLDELEVVARLGAAYADGDESVLSAPAPYSAEVMASALGRARSLRSPSSNDL